MMRRRQAGWLAADQFAKDDHRKDELSECREMTGGKKEEIKEEKTAQRLREEDDGETAAAVPGDWKLEGCWGESGRGGGGGGVTGRWRDDREEGGGVSGAAGEQRAEVRKWTMRRL